MHRLLLTTAAALPLAAGAALADTQTPGPFADITLELGENYLSTTLIGTRIHAVDAALDPTQPLPAGTAAEWDDVGEIGDLVIDHEGRLQAVIVDVGGFLGLAEREVAVRWDALVPVFEADNPAEVFLTIPATEEAMQNAPEVRRTPSEAEIEAMDAAAPAPTGIDVQGGMDAQMDAMVTDPAADVDRVATDIETAAEDAARELSEEADKAEVALDATVVDLEAGAEATAAQVVGAAEAAAATAEGVAQEAGEALEVAGDAAAEAGAEIEDETDAAN